MADSAAYYLPSAGPRAAHTGAQAQAAGSGRAGLTGRSSSSASTSSAHRSPPPEPLSAGDRHHSGSGSDEDSQQPQKKKKKVVLSCAECKRRKIKCSRTVPCEHCIKRGSACSWDDSPRPVPPRPMFARDEDLLQLATRVVELEKLLAGQPGEGAGAGAGAERSSRGDELSLVDDDESQSNLSDTEDAALKLETSVFHFQEEQSHSSTPTRFEGVSLNDRRAIFARMTGQPSPDDENPCQQAHHSSVHATHPEPTALGTSILAGPVTGPVCAAASLLYELDFAPSLDHIRRARAKAIRSILADTPEMDFSHWAVMRYLDEAHGLQHCIQQHTFLAEHDRFWLMRAQQRDSDIDPLWIAVWLIIVALATDSYRSVKPHAQTDLAPPDSPRPVDPDRLCWLAQKLMVIGDWQGKPQVRAIQATLLFGKWSLHTSSGIKLGTFPIYFAGAVKAAHLLGLHALGNDAHQMPPTEDPAWPAGANSVKREGAIHLWTQILFFDWLSTTPAFSCYMIDGKGCTTGPPANVNESELSAVSVSASKPRSVATDASFTYVKLRLSQATKLTHDKLIAPQGGFSYEAVLKLDSVYANILAELPLAWQREHPAAEQRDPRRRWGRNIAHQSVHSRLVRLHRPFLARGLAEPSSKYGFSAQQAIKSATVIITSHHDNLAWPTPYWFMYSYSLGASIVLFCDLFNAIDTGAPDELLGEKKETLVLAMDVFATWKNIAAPPLAAVIQTGSRIISGLILAVDHRRALQMSGSPSAESFAQVLTRVSEECAVPPPATPLPTNATSASAAAAAPASSAGQAPPLARASSSALQVPVPTNSPAGWPGLAADLPAMDPTLEQFLATYGGNTLGPTASYAGPPPASGQLSALTAANGTDAGADEASSSGVPHPFLNIFADSVFGPPAPTQVHGGNWGFFPPSQVFAVGQEAGNSSLPLPPAALGGIDWNTFGQVWQD